MTTTEDMNQLWNTQKRNNNFNRLLDCAFTIAALESQKSVLLRDFYEDRPCENFTSVYERAQGLFLGNRGFRDANIIRFLNQIQTTAFDGHGDLYEIEKFKDLSKKWVQHLELSDYIVEPMSQTIDVISNFVLKNSENRTVRCYHGDYWNKRYFSSINIHVDYINDNNISEGDTVVLTIPEHSSQDINNEKLNDLFDKCDKLGVPVIIDIIWLPFYKEKLNLVFNRDCIKTICLGVSKFFMVPHLRTGIKFTKDFDNFDYYYRRPTHTVKIINKLIERFPFDYHLNKYSLIQQTIAKSFDVEPSKLVTSIYCPDGCKLFAENKCFSDIEDPFRFLCVTELIDNMEHLIIRKLF